MSIKYILFVSEGAYVEKQTTKQDIRASEWQSGWGVLWLCIMIFFTNTFTRNYSHTSLWTRYSQLWHSRIACSFSVEENIWKMPPRSLENSKSQCSFISKYLRCTLPLQTKGHHCKREWMDSLMISKIGIKICCAKS